MRRCFVLIFLLLFLHYCQATDNTLYRINITTVIDGNSALQHTNTICMAAALLRVVDELRAPYSIHFVDMVNTQGNATLAHDLVLTSIQQHHPVAIIGSHFSSTSLPISRLGSQFQIPVISYLASHSDLSNKLLHPYFSRVTGQLNQGEGEALVDLCYAMQLENIALIYASDPYAVNLRDEFVYFANTKGVAVPLQQVVLNIDGSADTEEYVAQMRVIAQDTRIKTIVLLTTTTIVADAFLDAALQLHLFNSEQYQWVLSSEYPESFPPATHNAFAGAVFLQMRLPIWNDRRHLAALNLTASGTYCAFSYDAIMVLCNAINSISATTTNMFTQEQLLSAIRKQEFFGASGRILFDKNGDRIGLAFTILKQLETQPEAIGIWSQDRGQIQWTTTINNRPPIVQVPYYKERWAAIPQQGAQPLPLADCAVTLLNSWIMVYGGMTSDNDEATSDMWRYDFYISRWFQVKVFSAARPAARKDANLFTYNGKMYMFGGFDGSTLFNDMWIFDPVNFNWSPIVFKNMDRPSERRQSAIAVLDKQAILFGGQDLNADKNDMWLFDFAESKWTVLCKSCSIPARNSHCMQPLNSTSALVFGGFSNARALNDVWIVALTAGNNNTVLVVKLNMLGNDIEARGDTSCAMIHDNQVLLVAFGRKNTTYMFNDMYMLDLHAMDHAPLAWKQIIKHVPNHDARYNAGAVIYNNFFIWYGGQTPNTLYNDLWRLDLNFLNTGQTMNNIMRIHAGLQVIPPATTNHAAAKWYIFGGRTSPVDLSQLFYEFDLTSLLWKLVMSESIVPSAREYHTMIDLNDRIYLFGGVTTGHTYLQDLWTYNTFTRKWLVFEQPDKNTLWPEPRAQHVMVFFPTNTQRFILLFGGVTNGRIPLRNAYLYGSVLGTWTIVNMTNTPDAVIDCKGTMLQSDALFVVAGCKNAYGTPAPHVYALNMSTANWFIYATLPVVAYAGATVTAVGGHSLILFGGADAASTLVNTMYKIGGNRSITMDTTDYYVGGKPSPRVGHTAVYHEQKLFFFGGTGTITGNRLKLKSRIFNDVWIYLVGPLCAYASVGASSSFCSECGMGSFMQNRVCQQCAPGEYRGLWGQRSCRTCDVGTFGYTHGATTVEYCLPCPFATYNDKRGQSTCQPCHASMFCPLMSAKQSTHNDSIMQNRQTTYKIDQPMRSFDNMMNIERITLSAVLGVIMFLVVLWILSSTLLTLIWECIWYSKLDILFSESHNVGTGVMNKKRTRVGGIFSMAGIVIVFVITLFYFIFFFINNRTETRTLVPNLNVNADAVTMVIELQLNMTGFKGECTTCRFNVTGCSNSSINQQLQSIRQCYELSNATTERTCTVVAQFTCTSTSDEEVIHIAIRHNTINAFATSYAYRFTTTTGYLDGNAKSIIQGSIYPDSRFVFRGVTNTRVLLNAIPTIVKNISTTTNGMHLSFKDVVMGDLVDTNNFTSTNGFGVQFALIRAPYSLEIIEMEKRNFVRFATDTLASISGIIAATRLAMKFTERLVNYIQQCKRQVAQKRLAKKKQQAQDELQEKLLLELEQRNSNENTQ